MTNEAAEYAERTVDKTIKPAFSGRCPRFSVGRYLRPRLVV